MKKFFIALTVALMLTLANFAEAAAQFTQEQFQQMVAITEQNPSMQKNSTLTINVATFQQNYNAFMNDFISETNAVGNDAEMMRKIFLITEPKIFTEEGNTLFAQNFLNKAAIIGLGKDGDNFKVLTFFAVHSNEQSDIFFNVLILNAFIKGIAPDYDSTAFFNDIKKNQDATAVHNGIKYTISKVGNLEVITAVAK